MKLEALHEESYGTVPDFPMQAKFKEGIFLSI